MSVRYIGSKARLVEALVPLIGKPGPGAGWFVDAFCGTGVVAEAAASLGWRIRLNDHLECAVAMAAARLTASANASFRRLGGYHSALDQLNALNGVQGFIWREYSPASEKQVGVHRKYFREANAVKIDAIRGQIRRWARSGKLSTIEERLLIADLLAATNRVANIAGTYGCFLSHWTPQSKEQIKMRPRELLSSPVEMEVTTRDVFEVETTKRDVVYLDPPYTKRQYAAYYHLLETITVGDKPVVTGITGLRSWQDRASAFCYRTRALAAITDLVSTLGASRTLLSYSDQGHVPLEPLRRSLQALGTLEVHSLMEVGRYRPNRAASSAGIAVTEYVLLLERASKKAKKAAIA